MSSLRTIALTSLGSALIGGILGAFLVLRLNTGEQPVSAKSPNKNSARSGADLAAEQREQQQEFASDVERLEDRLSALERKRNTRDTLEKYAAALAAGDEKSKDDKGKDDKAPVPMAGVVDAEDPVFEMAVRSVLDQAEWEKEEERKLKRAKRQSDRTANQTTLLTEHLKLSPQQSDAVSQALTRQMERMRALRDADEQNGEARPISRQARREQRSQIRQQTENELREILDEEQLKGYRAFAEEEGIGPRP